MQPPLQQLSRWLHELANHLATVMIAVHKQSCISYSQCLFKAQALASKQAWHHTWKSPSPPTATMPWYCASSSAFMQPTRSWANACGTYEDGTCIPRHAHGLWHNVASVHLHIFIHARQLQNIIVSDYDTISPASHNHCLWTTTHARGAV